RRSPAEALGPAETGPRAGGPNGPAEMAPAATPPVPRRCSFQERLIDLAEHLDAAYRKPSGRANGCRRREPPHREDVEQCRDLRRAAPGDRVEASLVATRPAAAAFRDVQDDGKGRAFQ